MAEGAFLSNMVDRLSAMAMSGFSSILGAQEQVESLIDELQVLECFLKDADSMELRLDETAKQWLNSLRDVAYDAEDLVESVMLQGGRYSAVNSLLHPIDSYSFVKHIEEIKSKLRDMVDRRASYSSMIRGLGLVGAGDGESSSSASRSVPYFRWRRSSYHIGNTTIFGLEQDTDVTMERLFNSTEHREVIGIVGMGGLGKTTLASLVFNKACAVQGRSTSQRQVLPKATDPGSSNRSYFDVCAWVPVGQDPSTLLLLKILSTQIGVDVDLTNLAAAKRDMFLFLQDKRYLIVLDDVWRKETWHELADALPMATSGSKILMTTRSKEIAISADPASSLHELSPLNDELQDLGRQLSKKCGGLPLALVVLGGLLSGKEKQHVVWSSILNSMNWNDNEAGKQCLKILALSYNCLPYHMKLCFLYLGAFREEYEISVSKLTKLWIGDDLVPQQSGKTKEDTAIDNLNELLQRCLVQPVQLEHKQQPTRVCVHGLLRELAISEGRESRFLYCGDTRVVLEAERKSYRRLALHPQFTELHDLQHYEKLRALLIFERIMETRTICVGQNVCRPFINAFLWLPRWISLYTRWQPVETMPYIRIIEVEGLQIPARTLKSIQSSLIHLRYLSIRNTYMVSFPFTESKFLSLQTLDIRGTFIKKLPDAIWTLQTLRHLYLNAMEPPSISCLTDLQTFCGVLVSNVQIASEFSALRSLRKLQIELKAWNGYPVLIESLKQLRSLTSFRLSDTEISSEVITAIAEHQQLHKLHLQGILCPPLLPGSEHFADYITCITLSGSKIEIDQLKILGELRCLWELKLKDDALFLSEVSCPQNSFPELRYLKFSNLTKLEACQIETGAFQNLVRFSIHNCGEFRSTLNVLEHTTRLQVLKIKGIELLAGIAESCRNKNVFVITKT